jgi:hypothetical protein
MILSNEWQNAKRNARADQEAQAAVAAQAAIHQQMQINVFAVQQFIIRLDDELRNTLLDTFVRYCYMGAVTFWHLEPWLSVSVTVNKRNGTVHDFTIDNGVRPIQAVDTSDPVSLARNVTHHIGKELE